MTARTGAIGESPGSKENADCLSPLLLLPPSVFSQKGSEPLSSPCSRERKREGDEEREEEAERIGMMVVVVMVWWR